MGKQQGTGRVYRDLPQGVKRAGFSGIYVSGSSPPASGVPDERRAWHEADYSSGRA